jgi:hypothetical protein
MEEVIVGQNPILDAALRRALVLEDLWIDAFGRGYSLATFPPHERIFAFVPAASASVMLPARL